MSELGSGRVEFLAALRSGRYPKGPFIKGQSDPPEGATGYCAIGLAYTLLLNNEGGVMGLKRVLALTGAQISQIQNDWNDSSMTFPEIAGRIEAEMFA